MNAGTELDILIAQKVMGWKVTEQSIPVPAFSTDSASAWSIREALRDRGYDVIIYRDRVVVRTVQSPAITVEEIGKPFPLAMCLAALKAIGVKLTKQEGVL